MRFLYFVLIAFFIGSCVPARFLRIDKSNGMGIAGSEFYKTVTSMKWAERDSIAEKAILSGNMPSFLFKLFEIKTSIVDSSTGKTIKASYWVTPDYLSIGIPDDWARIPLTPMTAQRIADRFARALHQEPEVAAPIIGRACERPSRRGDLFAAQCLAVAPVSDSL